jgi:hypothetical protein
MRLPSAFLTAGLATGLLVLGAPTAVAAPSERTVEQYFLETTNGCNDEAVELSGTVSTSVRERSDGRVEVRVRVRATGDGSEGNAYVLRDDARQVIDGDDDLAITQRSVLRSQGAAPDLIVRLRLRIVDRETVLSVSSEKCRSR